MHRGWFYVLFGLLVSSFLGGAIHVFFSPERTRELVEKAVARKQPKFGIEFTEARLQLAGEWWPTVAVELKGLSVRAKDPCITNSTIVVDQLTVPLDMSSLLEKKMRFGHVRAGKVRVFLRPSTCLQAKPIDDVAGDDFAPFERFFQKRWSKEVVNTTRFLERLSVRTLDLLRDDQSLAPAVFHNIELDFLALQAESRLRFEAFMGPPWVGESPFGRIHSEVVIRASEVQIRAKGNLKEGQLQLRADWAIDRGEINMKLAAQDAPASGVLDFLHHWDYLRSLNPTIKNQWLSCDFEMAGDIRRFRNLPIQLHQCRLYGDFGEMQLLTSKIPSLEDGGEVRLQIQDVDVKRVLASFGFGSHWGIVSQFGNFSGDMIVNNRRTYELKGEVRNSEFYFKSSTNQVRQRVPSFALELAMNGERFSGRAAKVTLEGGEVFGGASFNISPAGDGIFQVALEKLVFPLPVQKGIWNGRISEAALFGQGKLAASQLEQFSGSIAFREWLTSQWELKTIKMPAQYQNGVWVLRPTAERFQLRPESPWAPAFNALFAELPGGAKELFVRQLRGEVTGYNGNWQWRDAEGLTSPGSLKISTVGSWAFREGLSGWVAVKYPQGNSTWALAGDWVKPEIKPSSDRVPSRPGD